MIYLRSFPLGCSGCRHLIVYSYWSADVLNCRQNTRNSRGGLKLKDWRFSINDINVQAISFSNDLHTTLMYITLRSYKSFWQLILHINRSRIFPWQTFGCEQSLFGGNRGCPYSGSGHRDLQRRVRFKLAQVRQPETVVYNSLHDVVDTGTNVHCIKIINSWLLYNVTIVFRIFNNNG